MATSAAPMLAPPPRMGSLLLDSMSLFLRNTVYTKWRLRSSVNVNLAGQWKRSNSCDEPLRQVWDNAAIGSFIDLLKTERTACKAVRNEDEQKLTFLTTSKPPALQTPFDDRISEPVGVRKSDAISLGWRQTEPARQGPKTLQPTFDFL